jgi:anti-sigma factor RsiW
MLACEEVELMIQDYLDGYLIASQREILESHVRGCRSCEQLLGSLTRLEGCLEGLGDVDAPDGLSSSILRSLPPQAYGPSPLRRWVATGGVPALVVVLLVAGLLFAERFHQRRETAGREVQLTFSAPQAASVVVVGDFNGWDPQRTRMVRSDHSGTWTARLKLTPGVHQYSFVIDGASWVLDPGAKTTLADGFGGKNSVIIIDS